MGLKYQIVVGLFYLVVFVLVFIIQYRIAKEFESVAHQKGHTEDKYFQMCFWLGLVGWILVAALPDRGGCNQKAVADKEPEGVASPAEPLVWEAVPETTAIVKGETNIECANCHRVQFKGNTTCVRCGAKFTVFEEK